MYAFLADLNRLRLLRSLILIFLVLHAASFAANLPDLIPSKNEIDFGIVLPPMISFALVFFGSLAVVGVISRIEEQQG